MYQKYHRYPELNRLVGAAVVSKRFRRMLLRDPERVLKRGYLGYWFDLSAEEAALVKEATAVEDVREFSLRVWEWMDRNGRERGSYLGEWSPQPVGRSKTLLPAPQPQ